MPCQRLAVKDAAGAAQRSKILYGEGHGHTLSRAARPLHHSSALTPTGETSLPALHRAFALPVAIPARQHLPRAALRADTGDQLVSGSHA